MISLKTLKSWFSLPEIGIWTWPMWWYRERNNNNDDERDINAIRYAIDKWITHIDTAELYAGWYSEELLWEAISIYDRNKLMINSKFMWSKGPKEIRKACEDSLKRMWINYFDVYYIHWRNKDFSLKEIINEMENLLEDWLIKNIWVCNFSTSSLIEAQSYCKYKIPVNQVHYNLIYRQPESDWLLKYCQENDIFLMAWRPLELAKLANTWSPKILDIAKKYNKSNEQVAINWLISQDNVVTIFKSSDINHINKNLWAVWWYMKSEDIEDLRENYIWKIFLSDAIPLK
jgi:diketogulonate reductase-like aldo/keto reductase